MAETHKSDSSEQRRAERRIFAQVQDELGVDRLEENPRITISDATGCCIEPDFFCDEPPVAGEIYAHIGALRPAQRHKIASDILKLLLLERVKGKPYRKIIAVCDSKVEDELRGRTYLAECVRRFGIELFRAKLEPEMEEALRVAQRRQRMVNS